MEILQILKANIRGNGYEEKTDGIICDLLASGTHSGDRGITGRQSYRPPPNYSCRSTNKYVAHVEHAYPNNLYEF